MHAFWLFAFAVTAVSRLRESSPIFTVFAAFKAQNTAGRVFQARPGRGWPNSVRKGHCAAFAKGWKPITFWLVSAGVFYWSLALGLLVLEVATRL